MRFVFSTFFLLILIPYYNFAQPTVPNCKQLLDSGEYHLYTSKNYKRSKNLLLASKDCFDSNNIKIPGANYLFLARIYYFDYEDSLSAINYANAISAFESEQDSLSLSKVYNSYANLISDLGYYDSA
jgi:hypothetical protein